MITIMEYLRFEEYNDLKYSDIEEEEFERLLPRASDVIDVQTRMFYQFHTLETDVAFRKDRFKKAIALQIEHMYLLGAVASIEVDKPVTWSMDGISVSSGNSSAAYEENKIDLISQDALDQLVMTGLLYKGIR